MPEDGLDGVFVSWVESLPEVDDDEAAVLQAVGFLSAGLRISADIAFITLREEARVSDLSLPTMAREVLGHQRILATPHTEACRHP
ncbi:ANTAR domain-containing protein [Rathayibacter sp. VKM Ac-2857]|uniref:ANTAR domain-containing protein n=1 Tax=Rathayibacter sp. VKM Ac-2857 TaxID=2739020 RepID=UPI0015637835|nr:ANTAR domain-containing protein [Rathayibacter sp. VKM Ac-2857]NQX14433.1 ANTAR domain-containing protein [Rathayibacter sp. VKM Ac-2857]